MKIDKTPHAKRRLHTRNVGGGGGEVVIYTVYAEKNRRQMLWGENSYYIHLNAQ